MPTENCVYRVLKVVPVLRFQQAVWAWQKARLGGEDGDVVVMDGKGLRGSQGTQRVGAINAFPTFRDLINRRINHVVRFATDQIKSLWNGPARS